VTTSVLVRSDDEGNEEGEERILSLEDPTDGDYQRTIRIPFPTGGVNEGITFGSAATAAAVEALPLELPGPSSFKLKLRVISRSVTSPKAPGMPFIIFASILVSLAVLGLVILRVMVDQSSFKVDDLGARVAQQQSQLTVLRYAVSEGEAPDRIAAQAAGMGLVPATQIQVLPTPATASQSGPGSQVATASKAGG
jgi:hypothetical protein